MSAITLEYASIKEVRDGEWRVRARRDDGQEEITLFKGPGAERRANAYLRSQYEVLFEK